MSRPGLNNSVWMCGHVLYIYHVDLVWNDLLEVVTTYDLQGSNERFGLCPELSVRMMA
jgi:hypothetical protein